MNETSGFPRIPDGCRDVLLGTEPGRTRRPQIEAMMGFRLLPFKHFPGLRTQISGLVNDVYESDVSCWLRRMKHISVTWVCERVARVATRLLLLGTPGKFRRLPVGLLLFVPSCQLFLATLDSTGLMQRLCGRRRRLTIYCPKDRLAPISHLFRQVWPDSILLPSRHCSLQRLFKKLGSTDQGSDPRDQIIGIL